MGLCCLPSQFWFLPFQAEAPGLPWRFTLVFVTWKVSGWGRSPGLKPISEIIFSPSNWFQEEHLTRGANDATRECVGWEVLALFPWKQNLKGVAEAFAAILLQKRSFLRTEPTERKMALFLKYGQQEIFLWNHCLGPSMQQHLKPVYSWKFHFAELVHSLFVNVKSNWAFCPLQQNHN